MGREFIDLFDGWAETYDDTVKGFDPQYKAVFTDYETILNAVVKNTTGKVLEFGVGTGNLTKKLLQAGRHVIGVEPSEAMRQIAQIKLPALHLMEGDFITFPESPLPIETIVSTYAFHHLTDLEKETAVKHFGKILPINGRIIFADTVFENEIAKEAAIVRAKDKGFTNLAEDLQREYYTTIGVLKHIFVTHYFDIAFKQMNEFVWLITATKNG